jgi:periplasmic divalent cation tolerance protein
MFAGVTQPEAGARIVLCTVPNEAVASQVAHALLDEHLVACVNVLPDVRSFYRWQGKIEDERELLLVMKTWGDRYAALEARVRELHPYEVCEVLAFDVAQGSAAYLAWLLSETRTG